MTFNGIFSLLLSKAQMGVQLFYVVSALTLTMSWNSRADGFVNFYIRRFFRIAPLFWIAIILYLALYGLPPRQSGEFVISWLDVALTATFTHMIKPSSINSVVPGGWSVAVEMSFYLIFPLLMLLIRGWKSGIIFIFVSYQIGKYTSGVLGMMYANTGYSFETLEAWKYWILSSQISSFAVGILLYYLIKKLSFFNNRFYAYLFFFFGIISGFLVFNFLQYGGPIAVLMYSCVFAFFGFGLSTNYLLIFKNKYIRKIGVLSYSAYLLHFSIIYIYKNGYCR